MEVPSKNITWVHTVFLIVGLESTQKIKKTPSDHTNIFNLDIPNQLLLLLLRANKKFCSAIPSLMNDIYFVHIKLAAKSARVC